MPSKKSTDPTAQSKMLESHDAGLSLSSSRPFDYHAWLATWQQEYVFFRVDERGRIDFVSPSVRSILGYRPEELIGREGAEIFDLAHPLHAQLVDLSDRLLANDPPMARRCVARHRDGHTAFLALRERELLNLAGELIGKEVMAQDVTARVEAELSLRQSERKYRRLVEGARGDYVIYSRDAQGLITYVSPTASKVFGYEPEEVIGRNSREFYRSESEGRELVENLNRQYEQGKLFQKFVVELMHRDGTPRTFEIQERPIFSVDGRLAAMEGIAKDVTEAAVAADRSREITEDLQRRVAFRTDELFRINEELRTSETRYRDVVETQTEMIIRWLPDGTRTFVNDAYCRFRNVTREELIGTSYFPMIHPEDRPVLDSWIAAITPECPSVQYELRAFHPDGSVANCQWTTRGFFNSKGQAVEYQSVGRDVTELKTAADLLRQKEAHLAHVSRLATMGEMVAGIAHEVSQPLHAAKTFAEAARRNLASGRPSGPDAAIECMTEISQAVTRTVQIIRRLREFTKARPVKLESLSLNAVVREAIELMAFEIRQVGATLSLELHPALRPIEGDRIQLEQLCVNLIKNSCEAVARQPQAERRILVRTFVDDAGAGMAVHDSGCGISEAEAERLFDAFYSTKEHGMGMGLSLCKSIAEAHHGNLRFEIHGDQPGVTFVFTLPTKRARVR